MAVQAQYPSNAVLLNRGIQEGRNQIGNDYSMQPQGGFVDQSHLIFNNISKPPVENNHIHNPRKRGRETNAVTPVDSILSSSVQQQQFQGSQLVDLAQLHTRPMTPHKAIVSTGLQLAFNDQRLQNHGQQSLSPQSTTVLSVLSEDFTTQMKSQRDEIDRFLRAQGDQLRRTLAEKRDRHYFELLRVGEETMAKKLREKESEVEKAVRQNADLQAKASHFSVESKVWQARVRAQETMLATLQAKLQHALMNQGCGEKTEGGLTCASGEGEAEDAESAYIDPERVEMSSRPSCKACGKRVASAVLLPCRHLSVCTECDGVIQACPVCFSLRSSSVEVFLE